MSKFKDYVEKKARQLHEYGKRRRLETQINAEKRAQRLEREADYQEKLASRATRAMKAQRSIAESRKAIRMASPPPVLDFTAGGLVGNTDLGLGSMFGKPQKKGKRKGPSSFFEGL